MELRQLKYFVAVAGLSSITRAAETLHTSQPNITTALKKLENELGVLLFTRKQKRLYLTSEGQQFLGRVKGALNEIENAINDISKRNSEKGKIRIGIPPSIGAVLFPTMVSKFADLHPDIDLAVVEEGSWLLSQKLEAGELDLGIMILTDISPKLDSIFLEKQQIMVCLPASHRLIDNEGILLSELANEQLIMLGENSYHHHIIVKEFERLRLKPNILITSNQVETIKGLVAKRIGVSFLFAALTNQLTDIITRPLDPPMFVNIGLVWKKSGLLSGATRTFINFFRNE